MGSTAVSSPRSAHGMSGWLPWLRGKQGPVAAVSPTNVDGVWRQTSMACRHRAVCEFVLPGEVDDEYLSYTRKTGAAGDEECASAAFPGGLVAAGDADTDCLAAAGATAGRAASADGLQEGGGEEDARYAAARMVYALSESSMDLALSARLVQHVAQLAWQHGPGMEGAATTIEYSEAARPPDHRQMQRARQALLRLQTSTDNIDSLLASPLHCEFATPSRCRPHPPPLAHSSQVGPLMANLNGGPTQKEARESCRAHAMHTLTPSV